MKMPKQSSANSFAAISYCVVGIIAAALAYYLDHARIAAFIIVPGFTLRGVFEELGINRISRPGITYGATMGFILYALIVMYYILVNPIAK